MSFFRLDSPLMRGLSHLADLMLLNILAVVCSIPIFTLGASASALYYAVGHLQEDEGTPVRDFFRAFRQNFAQATGIWLILLVCAAVLLLATLYYLSVNLAGSSILLAITCLAWLLWAFLFAWVFPLQCKFENTVRRTIHNALLLSLGYFPRSLLMAVLNAVPVAVALLLPAYFLAGGIVWLGIWFSLAASINWRLLKKPLERLIASSEVQEQDEQA